MSFGNAFGAFVPRRGGGGGPSAPAFAPRIVVGNALPPYSDTVNDCDILDPGDGSGIAAALAQAAVLPEACDVWIRPGVYDLRTGPVATPLVIPTGARVWGAGKSTVIIGRATGRRRIFEMQLAVVPLSVPTTELAWLSILVPDTIAPATDNEAVYVTGGIGYGGRIHDLTIETLAFTQGGFPNITAPFAMLRIDMQGSSAGAGISVYDTLMAFPQGVGNAPDPVTSGFCCILAASSGAPNEGEPINFTRVVCIGGDYPLACVDMSANISQSEFNCPDFGGAVTRGTAAGLFEYGATCAAVNSVFANAEEAAILCTNQFSGIVFDSRGANVTNCILQSDNGVGLALFNASPMPQTFVSLLNNNTIEPGNNTLPAIRITRLDDNLILGNRFQNATTPAVDLISSSNNEIAHNVAV